MPALKKDAAPEALGPERLREIFNDFARDAVRDYPAITGRFAILNLATHEHHGEIDLQKSGFADEAAFAAYLGDYTQKYKASATSRAMRKSAKGLLFIGFNGASAVMRDPERDVMKTLDHELGHLLVEGAIGGKTDDAGTNFRECAADVFAALRDMQRNGTESGLLERLAWHRAVKLARKGDGSHFTTFALQKLDEVKDRIDFSRLTPQQTTQLAWTIAAATALPQAALQRLGKKLAPLARKKSATEDIEDRLKNAADLLHGEKDQMTSRALLAYLAPYLASSRSFDGSALKTQGAEWDAVRQLVAEKNAKIASVGLLAGMPIRRDGGSVVPFRKK